MNHGRTHRISDGQGLDGAGWTEGRHPSPTVLRPSQEPQGPGARTYWSPLLLSLPHDGRPPQLGEGRSFPQELVVEEQDPLLLSLEQGTGEGQAGGQRGIRDLTGALAGVGNSSAAALCLGWSCLARRSTRLRPPRQPACPSPCPWTPGPT